MQLRVGMDAASTALLDLAFRDAPVMFYIAEATEHRDISYVSPNIEQILGYSAASLLEASSFWRARLHPDDAGNISDALGRIAETRQILEYRILDAQNSYRWIKDEVRMVYPQDGSAPYLQGYWQDISEQKSSVTALQEKVHSMQAVLDSLPQHLLWKDRRSVFLGCNLAAAREIGLERTDQIIGKTDFDFHASHQDAEYLFQIDEAVMATGQASYHADIPSKQDGVWLDVTKVPLNDEHGVVNGLLISYEDVSEQRRNRLELNNFRRAVEQSPSTVIITDLKGNIEYVNPRFLQLYGYTEHEVIGKNVRLLKSGSTNATTYREMWKTIRSGKSWHGEFYNRARNGELYWQSASISPIFDETEKVSHFLAIEDDLTQRKRLEETLQQQLSFTQALLNALPHPVYYKSRDGIYRGCNHAFEEFIGLRAGEIVGKTVFDIAPENIARVYLEKDNELFAHPGVQAYETKLRHHDGTLRDVWSHKATFLDGNGEVAGIIGSTFDISDRKRIEEELKRSEERFRTIAHYTYNWENWVDSDGTLLWVNPAVERITGYTPDECYAMRDFPVMLIHPDDRPVTTRHYAESLSGAAHRDLEFRILRKDGEIRWGEVVVQQVYDEHGRNIGHRSSITDVTDRRLAVDALYHTRDMLQIVLDHIPQGVFWKNTDGIYLGGNAVLTRDLGLNHDWINKGLTDFDIFPAEEARKFRDDDQKVMRNNQPFTSIEEQFTDSNGAVHWILTSKVPLHNRQNEVIGVLGAYTDLTEMRQLNAELRESESRIREITETVGEGIYVMDENGLLIFVNPEAEALLGWSAAELLGKLGHAIFHACEHCNSAAPACLSENCQIINASRLGSKFSSDEETFCRKDGTHFNVSIRATPYMRNGRYSGTVVAFHDITEQKQTQLKLRETLLQLRVVNESLEKRVEEQTQGNLEKERMLIQQSRSAAMGEMISNIAHQWRQPLSTLGLVVQNIQLDYRENDLSPQALDKYVDVAKGCVMRMSQTIDDFRDFFRPDKAKKCFNVHKAIRDSLRLLEATLKNHEIQVILPDDPGFESFGHENEFSQVMLNLLANAKDALLENGTPHGRIEIALSSTDHTGMVSVRDNAGGVPDELMERIFDPYFTTKAGGTGIGLYMSKMIIEKHMDGNIVCHNTAEGAEFTVTVPLWSADMPKPEQ